VERVLNMCDGEPATYNGFCSRGFLRSFIFAKHTPSCDYIRMHTLFSLKFHCFGRIEFVSTVCCCLLLIGYVQRLMRVMPLITTVCLSLRCCRCAAAGGLCGGPHAPDALRDKEGPGTQQKGELYVITCFNMFVSHVEHCSCCRIMLATPSDHCMILA
jgi:hypothetical protein